MTTTEILTVDQVVDRMRTLAATLPAGDGVEIFNAMYLEVTELVRARLASAYFDDPVGMARLDTVFAARYLAAVDTAESGGQPAACWRPLFELRGNRGVHPLQSALAGMNAHIENDLPLSVLDCCDALGKEPGEIEADYHRINDLLAQVESQVREELLPGPEALRIADPLMHVIGVWSIDRARDAAWATVLGLWELRRTPLAYDAVTAALSSSVGMVSRALLTPLNGAGY
ncbi:DUF5995 family protein [Kitasatospora sp. GP82]|uniref:DUF5995 family protein n=1 Tax=Kitasatospora sp. GP82 TaxID=3035089 RepID=UPI0024731569|nr:DUF5995 family protein [Kitasatospora sp. GP82]MDH6124798.1 hypothetical protein [Kitasatospora sp. GP82]